MKKDLAAPVRRQLEAYNALDLESFLDCFSASVVLESDGDGSSTRGREAMRRQYAALFARHPLNRCTVLHRTVVGRHVVDEELIEGRGGAPFRTVAIYRVEGGAIAHVRFLDREEAKQPAP